MFLTDASLFINGNNNAISAKTLINDCIKELSSFDFDGSSDCSELKSNLSECKIEDLITRIDTSKEDLLKLDNDFAQQYISLLAQYYNNSSLDTSRMTDEEKMQYNIQMDSLERNYYTSLLIMLEDYESRDLLTDEMKKQLDFTRVKVEQYGIRDKMSVLSEDAEGYLELFETFANYDRKLIKLNPELDENKKATLLSNYETEYNSLYDRLKDAREKRVTKEQGMAELAQLQKEMDENNGWIHPILENEYKEKILDKKIELGIATQSEIDYKNMDGWNRFWTDTGTFVASAYTGLYSIVEGAEDGVVMLGGKVGICDKDWASEFVKKDRSAELYDGIVLSTGMNTYSAYSKVHDVGEFFGNTVGAIGMSFACPWASAVMSGLSAMGSSSEKALNSGSTFDEAFTSGAVSAAAGAIAGGTVSKLGTLAAGSTSLLQVGKNTVIGMGVSMLEPIVNSVTEYSLYANDMFDETGAKVYNNFWDYYVEGGGLTSTGMALLSSGVGIGLRGIRGYNNYRTVCDEISSNYKHMNKADLAMIDADIKRRWSSLSNEQVWGVVQSSGNSYFKDVDLKVYNLITPKNAGEFIKYSGYNDRFNTFGFALDWNDHGGYIPSTITSFKDVIESSPEGRIYASRVGNDGGHAWSSDWDSTCAERAIPIKSGEASAGIIDGRRYVEAIDICASSSDDLVVHQKLIDAGYDSAIAEQMIDDYRSWNSLPEVSGLGGLNEVVPEGKQSIYGYAGKAAPWNTKSVKMQGGGSQVISVFSWGTMRNSGIMTDSGTIKIGQ